MAVIKNENIHLNSKTHVKRCNSNLKQIKYEPKFPVRFQKLRNSNNSLYFAIIVFGMLLSALYV